ncbi:MAG: 30S ribosomal protein S20 [Thermodesulfovibrionales bacterium]|nr:30S ribosomal protein S20 [Thermodesulfovibrionales bacterium]
MPAKATPKKNLSAIKRSRQAEKQNLRNRAVRSTIKTVVKKVETAVVAGKKEEAGKELTLAIKALTKAASKGVIHKNTASRNISRLSRKVNAIPAAGAA